MSPLAATHRLAASSGAALSPSLNQSGRRSSALHAPISVRLERLAVQGAPASHRRIFRVNTGVRVMASAAGARSSGAAGVVAAGNTDAPLAVMVNSCFGKMGNATAVSVVKAGLTLVPYSFNSSDGAVAVEGVSVTGVPEEERDAIIGKVREEYPNLIIVDYTLPDVVTSNCEYYSSKGLNFVVGTTGGDRERMHEAAEEAGVYAVIAPNMGKQIVAVQAMVEMLAERFPGAFAGYKLSVVESHQKTKVDTSGTAKAVVDSMGTLGCEPFEMSEIKKLRDDISSNEKLGVPMNAMNGHAFHTYTLTSPEGDVEVKLSHNVIGRTVYAEGTVDACIFLSQMAAAKSDKKVYNMVDVLESGFMR